jgi:ribosomal protein L40E
MMRSRRPKRSSLGLVSFGLVLIGVVGALTITRVSVGSYPWEPAPGLEITAWRTFDGVFTVAFGFVLTIGVALLVASVVGKGITCPRCGTWNPKRASICETCELRLGPAENRVQAVSSSSLVGRASPIPTRPALPPLTRAAYRYAEPHAEPRTWSSRRRRRLRKLPA